MYFIMFYLSFLGIILYCTYMCIGFYHYKRQAATHVFVIMISPEDRRVKPYALPVQLVSYAGLNQSRVRSIINGVIAEMTKREMKVADKILCTCMYRHWVLLMYTSNDKGLEYPLLLSTLNSPFAVKPRITS